MMAPVLNSLSTAALDGIVELKRNYTDLTAGCLLSMYRDHVLSPVDTASVVGPTWSWSDCPPFRSLNKSVSESPVVFNVDMHEVDPAAPDGEVEVCLFWTALSSNIEHLSFISVSSSQFNLNFGCDTAASRNSVAKLHEAAWQVTAVLNSVLFSVTSKLAVQM